MNRTRLASLLLAPLMLAAAPLTPPAPATPAPSPTEIVAAAPAGDWVDIAAADLLVMDLARDRDGKARRVVIQLLPAPFSQGWVGNIRKLAAAQWWDGTSINRVQDNYVTQWGDVTEKKPLPQGLAVVPQADYSVTSWRAQKAMTVVRPKGSSDFIGDVAIETPPGVGRLTLAAARDAYAKRYLLYGSFPIAETPDQKLAWPLHCYGMVGVGRNLPPDTGTGAELYTVIGHAPRQLDRNIALVGRVVSGMELMSSLPRGTGALGFYETAAERVPIVSVRLASNLPEGERPHLQYLGTDSASFTRYADARANRRDPFYLKPAGGVDICNVPVPIRKKP